ncbi:unnamed protein product [Prorocentrum cordatum]|uniref:Uncharacterized protein n=1 Tax=Prorocentrum cordatum TaxID=2364126 RepID=A0ABN9TEA8_9DINO|nr:unnamed protein product [Polarella glacialis]
MQSSPTAMHAKCFARCISSWNGGMLVQTRRYRGKYKSAQLVWQLLRSYFAYPASRRVALGRVYGVVVQACALFMLLGRQARDPWRGQARDGGLWGPGGRRAADPRRRPTGPLPPARRGRRLHGGRRGPAAHRLGGLRRGRAPGSTGPCRAASVHVAERHQLRGRVHDRDEEMSGSKGAELIAWSTTGTSSSDSITTQGGIGSDTVVTLALSKPDGRLDTVTQMDSSVSIVGDGMSISVSMGYDGTDTWDMSGSLSENGDTAASIEAHLHEQWVSVASWVYEYGPLGDIGPLYMYANASIPSISDFSDMWEVHYFQTSDFIETANATWHMDTSVGEYSLAASSYTMEKDDGGEWRYTSSVNVTVDHIDTSAAPTPAPPMLSRKTVEGSFRATVAASEAQAFVSNADVEASFVASIAQRAGVPESMVQVTLSVVSSGGRRLSSGEVEILVTYAITAEVGASDDAGVISDTAFDSMVDTLASTSAEDFVVDFASELEATGSASSFSAVVAVPGSATAPMVTETSEKMSGAQAAFPQALLLAAICMLMV